MYQCLNIAPTKIIVLVLIYDSNLISYSSNNAKFLGTQISVKFYNSLKYSMLVIKRIHALRLFYCEKDC